MTSDQPAPLLPPLADDAWPAGLEHLRDGFAGKLNVYRVMAHHPALLKSWETLRNHVVIESALPPDAREIVILRVGHRWGSRYEWAQHVVRGRQAGLSDDRIAGCRADPAALERGTDRLLVEAVDILLAEARLAPGILAALEENFGREGLFDLIATVGMYTTLAFIVNSFATPVEPEMLRELAANPLVPSVDQGR